MAKKELIMDKAIELFAEQGFEATSVQQITERCGISKGGFYLYFKSKDELIHSMIDQFMSNFIAEIERSVSLQNDDQNLLHDFLFVIFNTYQEQADFTKIFLKEHGYSFNEDLLETLKMYAAKLNQLLFSVIQKQYANIKLDMQIELFFMINGLMKSYSELILIEQYPADIERLCKAIVEKVTIVAKHASVSSISEDYLQTANIEPEITKEAVLKEFQDVQEESKHEPIIMESVELLLQDLEKPELSPAVRHGLLNNLWQSRSGKWAAYLYRQFILKKRDKQPRP